MSKKNYANCVFFLFSLIKWNALSPVELIGVVMLNNIHMKNAVNCILKLRFIVVGPFSRNKSQM